jgi:hypothetical protein
MTRCTVYSRVTVTPTGQVAPSPIFLCNPRVVLVVSYLDILLSVVIIGNSYKHEVHDEHCQSVWICLGTSGGSLAYHLFILPDGIKVRYFLLESRWRMEPIYSQVIRQNSSTEGPFVMQLLHRKQSCFSCSSPLRIRTPSLCRGPIV